MDFSAALPEKKKKEIIPKQAFPLLDLEKAKERFKPYLTEINSMLDLAKSIVVDTDEKNVEIVSLGTKAMKLFNELLAMKKEHPDYKIAKKFVDGINDFLKIYTEKLYSPDTKKETIVSISKSKNSQYRAFQEQKRRKAELAAQKATEELQEKLNEEAKKTGTAPVQVEMPIIPKQQGVTRSETGSAYGTKHWTFEIVEPHHVRNLIDELENPQKDKLIIISELKKLSPYLVLSETEIRNAIKAGIRNPAIPGVNIFEKEGTSFRT
jgi:hypothetical protein